MSWQLPTWPRGEGWFVICDGCGRKEPAVYEEMLAAWCPPGSWLSSEDPGTGRQSYHSCGAPACESAARLGAHR